MAVSRVLCIAAAVTSTAAVVPTAWPSNAEGGPLYCQKTTVIHDMATGWPGKCLGLKAYTDDDTTYTAAECAKLCGDDSGCDAWQLTAGDTPNRCYRSVEGFRSYDCFGRDGENQTFQPAAGQRIQQGDVTVVQNLTSEWVDGLYQIGIGHSTEGTENVDRCKQVCESDVACRYWQYGSGGCWVERRPDNVVPDPAVTSTESDAAKTMVRGEVIQHSCPPVPPPAEETNWLLIGLIALLALLAILACLYFACAKETKKPKRTRAVKLAPKAAPAPVTLVYAPMTYAVPQPTYQMVPQAPVVEYVQPAMMSSVVMPQAASVMMPQGGSVMMPQAGSVMQPLMQPAMGGSIVMR